VLAATQILLQLEWPIRLGRHDVVAGGAQNAILQPTGWAHRASVCLRGRFPRAAKGVGRVAVRVGPWVLMARDS